VRTLLPIMIHWAHQILERTLNTDSKVIFKSYITVVRKILEKILVFVPKRYCVPARKFLGVQRD